MLNPFQSALATAWDDAIVDLPSLNKQASDLIADRIEAVRAACRGGLPTRADFHSTSVLLLGAPGVGKTHLFNRLRDRFGRFALFVLQRPEIAVETTPRHVLASAVDALRQRPPRTQHQQIDVVAGAVLAHAMQARTDYPIQQFRQLLARPPEEIDSLVDQAVERAVAIHPEVWPEYLGRLVRTAFTRCRQERWAAMTWLSGREPSEAQLGRLGERSGLGEADVLPALRTLGVAAALGAPLVLVFDQLENLVDDGGADGRIRAHAQLVSELRDSVRGIVIVQMALESEWAKRIRPRLVGGEKDRVEESARLLEFPSPAQKRDLVELWVGQVPPEERRGPFPWPFSEAQLAEWTRADAMSPRKLMQACNEALLALSAPQPAEASGPAPADRASELAERLGAIFGRLIEEARAQVDGAMGRNEATDGERLEAAIARTLGLLEGASVGEARPIRGVPSRSVRARGRTLDIVVAQHVHHTSLAATLRKAIARAASGLVLVVREQALGISPRWREVRGLVQELSRSPSGRFVQLAREDVVRMLALHALLGAARSQDLSDARGDALGFDEVLAWARADLEAGAWAVSRAVMGEDEPETTPEVDSPRAAAPRCGEVVSVLARLRVASIERIAAEVRARDPAAGRAAIVGELTSSGARFIGPSIVAVRETVR